MALTTLTVNELYNEIADLARDQGVGSRDVWDELVEEVVESHLSLGEIDLDEDVEGMKEVLQAKWADFKKKIAEDEEEGVEETGNLSDDKEDKDDYGDGDEEI